MVTASEFLKELEMTEKKNENTQFIVEDLGPTFLSNSGNSNNNSFRSAISNGNGTQTANTSFTSNLSITPSSISTQSTMVTLIPSPQSAGSTAASLSLVSPTSTNNYEQMLLQQSTPLKLQIDSQSKAVSKSKKLGQILKLASVRGAKV